MLDDAALCKRKFDVWRKLDFDKMLNVLGRYWMMLHYVSGSLTLTKCLMMLDDVG